MRAFKGRIWCLLRIHHLFVFKLIQERNLDPLTAFVRISLDGGGAFFKVIVNVFDALEDTLSNSFLNSGV